MVYFGGLWCISVYFGVYTDPSAKRRLKGTKFVVTENLTRRRNDLLKKVRLLDAVSCAWTTDGRIICLLGDGRKVTVLHERDIDTLSTGR